MNKTLFKSGCFSVASVFAAIAFCGCIAAPEDRAVAGYTQSVQREFVSISDPEDIIDSARENLIVQYGTLYAKTLTGLSAENPSELFEDSRGENAFLNKTAFWVISHIRSCAALPLAAEYMYIDYTVTAAETDEDGNRVIMVTESNRQKFSHLENEALSGGLNHIFIFSGQGEQSKIRFHRQGEDFFLLTMELWDDLPENASPREKSRQVIQAVKEDTRENLQTDFRIYTADSLPQGEYFYDRNAAVDYAASYWNTRNLSMVYIPYDMYGGNCQNFCSQAMYAGGLNMDYSGHISNQWKWYSDTINERATPYGRSYAWTGVDEFYAYAASEYSGGIECLADRDFSLAQPGDIIQLGACGQWRHSVMITDIIYDDRGNILDILIASNTADRYSYPVSAYVYTAARLIHILGVPV